MSSLVKIYKEFESHPCISYFPEFEWPEEDPAREEVDPIKYPGLKLSFKKVEALLIQKISGFKEFLLVGAFEEERLTRLMWVGENAGEMKKNNRNDGSPLRLSIKPR